MEKYDYKQAIINDLKEYLKYEKIDKELTYEELYDNIYDNVYNEDNVTGNGVDYYDTEEKCSEYLSNNFDLLYEAMREFCVDGVSLVTHYEDNSLARYFDCTIRCYLLGECLEEVLNQMGIHDERM